VPPTRAPSPAIRTLYDDDDLLVIDKPPGLLCHADADHGSVLAQLRQQPDPSGRDPAELRLVHRLDRDTSGVLVLARGAEAARLLGEAFRARRVFKLYLALTTPVPAVRWAMVNQRLSPRRTEGGERMVVIAEGGVAADSEVEVLARGRRLGLVRVIPEQGRKHQVRVALSELGAPIVGDFLYGGARVARMAPRMMLHARALELAHPLQPDQHLRLIAPLPADLQALLREDGCIPPADLDRRHRR
jgi:RluA family pseudouridine synthase